MILNKINILFYRLFGSAKLRSYESACIKAWKDKISKDAADLLNAQLASVDLIQRMSEDKIAVFYSIKNNPKQSDSDRYLFPLRSDEVIVSRVYLRLKGADGRNDLQANIILHQGRLSSIEFNKSPKNEFAKSIQSSDIEIIDIKILHDPMSESSDITASLDPNKLGGWMHKWASKWKLRTIIAPLSSNRRKEILNKIETALPSDYLDLVSQTEGFVIGRIHIYGISKMRTIVLPKMNFYILADIENNGSIGVKQGELNGKLYYIDNEDDRPRDIGSSIKEAVENLLREES